MPCACLHVDSSNLPEKSGLSARPRRARKCRFCTPIGVQRNLCICVNFRSIGASHSPFIRKVTVSKTRLALVASALMGALGCNHGNAVGEVAPLPTASTAQGPIARVERPSGLDPTSVELGRELFGNRRLSGNGKLACSSCHDLSNGGADHVALSVGIGGEPLAVNTPTVFNAALNFRQFWDGRASTLEEQIDGPLLSSREMGSSWPAAVAAVSADADLATRFARRYPQGVAESSIKDALATFEASLATPNAPFDRYLSGETNAIDAEARRGFELFTSYGCSSCHQGRGVGGNMFQKLGVMGDYFADRGGDSAADQGRFNVTHDEADRHVFKVPSLRNVALTAPYLHDGSVATLDGIVRVMARYQLGRDLEAPDADALVAFLRTLTGTYEGKLP